MKGKPVVGQRVRLTDKFLAYGYLKSREQFRDADDLVITHVGENIGYDHDPIYVIQVDKPSINKFLLDQDCVELIP